MAITFDDVIGWDAAPTINNTGHSGSWVPVFITRDGRERGQAKLRTPGDCQAFVETWAGRTGLPRVQSLSCMRAVRKFTAVA